MESITTPDLGMIGVPIGTILVYCGYEYDNQPKREGWVWYNFERVSWASLKH